MEPSRAHDKFRLREIEQQLAAELQAANEKRRKASTQEEKAESSESHRRALQRFVDFVAKGIVPKDLSPS
jgi:hypothetical protein